MAKRTTRSKKKIDPPAPEMAEQLMPPADFLPPPEYAMMPPEPVPVVEEPPVPAAPLPSVLPLSLLTELDIYLFREGRHYRLYDKLGAHLMQHEGMNGTNFAVWAPNAEYVSVIGDFNGWDSNAHPLYPRLDSSGIWEGFIPELGHGCLYKYHIRSRYHGYQVSKADPFAFFAENPPRTASVVWDMQYKWNDKKWQQKLAKQAGKPQAVSVYELHLGSWRRVPEEDLRSFTYRELAHYLPKYVKELGFTHVEFMPIMEHPFYGSWGYQITGYFAATSRYGTPQDLMYLIDALHAEGIGVILDWVPSHFPSDEHGLVYFDGTHLFEHADPRKGYHPDWNSYIFNYGRNEVKSFLISNALFWLEQYHADGLRVDAVASMLYLDYSRKHDEWVPNEFGGRENLEAISFLRDFNEAVHEAFPFALTIAEESTAWPMVSRPPQMGGLGFNMKWMMGWMHDTLKFMSLDPLYRQYHLGQISFSIIYAFTENFMLPLSHDEVVYGKGALLRKMPGDEWQQFANLRTLYSYMFAHPGAKLLFMGGEFGQTNEWAHESSLDWHLLQYPLHQGMQKLISRLNQLYQEEKALYENDFSHNGFEWIDFNDTANSVVSFLRKGNAAKEVVMVVCNFTPMPRHNYRLGVPVEGTWEEILNTDAAEFGGSNVLNPEPIETEAAEMHGRQHSLALTLPPLGVVYLKYRK